MPIPHPTLQRPVRTAEELTTRWQVLAALGRDPYDPDDPHDPHEDTSDLWIQLFDATGHAHGVLVVVEGVDAAPDDELTGNLAGVLAHLLTLEVDGEGAVALALVPRTRRDVVVDDLAWAQALVTACRAEAVALLGVHLVSGVRARRLL